MQAYTDASIRDGYVVHSYVLIDKEKVTLKRLLRSNIEKVHLAELTSIIALLLHCQENGIKNILVNTDNQGILQIKETSIKHGKFVIWMRHLLKLTGSSIQWISRKRNRIADEMCRIASKQLNEIEEVDFQYLFNSTPKVKSPELKSMELKPSRVVIVRPDSKVLNIESIESSEIAHLQQYYCEYVIKDKRRSVEDILKWSGNEKYVNTKRGRRYLVEKFIVENHNIEDIHKLEDRQIFDFKYE